MRRALPLLVAIPLLVAAPTADAKPSQRARLHALEKQMRHAKQTIRELDRELGILQDDLAETTRAAQTARVEADSLLRFVTRCFYGMPSQTFALPGTDQMTYVFQPDQPGVWLAAINPGCVGPAAGATALRPAPR